MCPSARDVHRKRSQIAVVDDTGVPNDPVQLVPILGALPPSTPVAFEAAYGWGWLGELLEELQLEPHLVHPSRCKAIASARLKNDKVDATTLAQLLRVDLLPRPGSPFRRPGICGACCATVGSKPGFVPEEPVELPGDVAGPLITKARKAGQHLIVSFQMAGASGTRLKPYRLCIAAVCAPK